MPTHPEITQLLENLSRGFDRRSWHGPNLMGAIRGLKPEEAAWRPQPGRHNAWEYIVHAAYWKYRELRVIDSQAAGSFSLPGSNFFERPTEPTRAALKDDIELLREWHRRLLDAVAAVDPALLDEKRGEFTIRAHILGIAAHDVYHAGQIRLLRRMWGDRAAG